MQQEFAHDATAQPSSTRSSRPPNSTASIPGHGSPTSSPASAIIRWSASRNCCRGNGRPIARHAPKRL